MEQTLRVGTISQLLVDIGLVLLFIALAALFVAAEIALLSLRESQVRQLQSKGKRGARVHALTQNPNRFLAAAQIGVTFCGFLSAALGSERLGTTFVIPTLENWGVSHGVATTLSLVAVTIVIAYVSLVFGELVPKRLAIYRTESIALASAGIIDQLAKFFRPTIWLLSRSTDAVVKLFGLKAEESRSEMSEAELVDLVTGHTALTDEERDIVEEVFNSGDLSLHEIMVPRTEVDFLDVGASIADAMKMAVESAHSRYPVTRGNSDEVIGFLHVRDLLNIEKSRPDATILDLIRPVTFLPGTKGVLPALTELRAKRQHLAIVLDEYGGTDGIVTLEDLVECFIGDIHDEYDSVEEEVTPQSRTGDFEVDALISLEDLYDETGIVIPEGPYETMGGYVMHALGRLPEIHDVLRLENVRITVLSVEGKRAGQLLITRDEWKDTPHE
ncbi:MAG: hypothetical protein RL414_222 [Actinomycetota bacterium]